MLWFVIYAGVPFLKRDLHRRLVAIPLERYVFYSSPLLLGAFFHYIYSYTNTYNANLSMELLLFKIMGGCDKKGFPMKYEVVTHRHVHLLLQKGRILF